MTRMPPNKDLDLILPPSPRSPHMYGSPEGMSYSPAQLGSPRAKTSPRTKMLKKWPRKDERRMLNVVCRVGNIEESIKYYRECLGMHILRRIDYPEDKYLTVFMGYGTEDNHLVVELTYNYGVTEYDIGNGLNHLGLAVPNVQSTLDEMRKKGFPAPASTSVDLNGNVYAMIQDPTGYPFKLIQRKGMRERFWQVSFKVGDIDAAILFYQDVKPPLVSSKPIPTPAPPLNSIIYHSSESVRSAFGMFLLARNDYPLHQKTFAYLAYNLDDTMTTVVELEYNYGVTEYNHGTGYAQLAICTDDVYITASAVELQHGRTTRPPGPLPGIPTKIYACLDPDGWKVIFVDKWDFSREQEPASFVPRVTTVIELKRNSAYRCPGHLPELGEK